MVAALDDRQWELGDGAVFGAGLDIEVTSVGVGAPDVRSADAAPPQMDGTRFGRDERAGRLITFGMAVLDTDDRVLDRAAALEAAWLADEVRREPGALSTLRYRLHDRTRRVYGRPRRFAANPDPYRVGQVLITCDFQCVDHLFYADDLTAVSVGVVPPSSGGGFDEPMVEPWTYVSVTESRPGEIRVVGDLPVSPVVTIWGPITDPIIRISGIGDVKVNTTLASAFASLVVDTRHWEMTVIRNDGASLAGKLDWSTPPLDRVLIPPGVHTVVLRGEDETGTARMTVEWREVYAGL